MFLGVLCQKTKDVGVFACQKGEKMASLTSASYPIVGVLVAAEKFLGPNRTWKHHNEDQAILLEKFFRGCRQDTVRIPEMKAIADWDATVINEFLRVNGFTIQLEPFDARTFGVANVLDLLVEWIIEGEIILVRTPDRQEFPGVHLGEKTVNFFSVFYHPYPIAQIVTKSQDLVLMTMLEKPPAKGFALDFMSQELFANKKPIDDFSGLIFPMVDLSQEVDISWLRGMETISENDGQPAIITQALQQNKLRMNEIGARVQSAVAISVLKACMPVKVDHIINQPFLVWFVRPGLNRPLFAGYIDREHWKNPGDLSQK
jgi:hypothetical protein